MNLRSEKRAEQQKRSYEKHKQEIARRRAEKRRTNEGKEKNRLRQKDWRRKNSSRTRTAVAGWKKRNPQKAACHTLILWAIRTALIKKPEKCEECCEILKLEGHHRDYLKPLEVTWLCKNCHAKKHRIYR